MTRPATPSDIDALVKLLTEAHALEITSGIRLVIPQMRRTLAHCIVNREWFSWVADDVSSALFGRLTSPWYSDQLVASDLFFYGGGAPAGFLARRFVRWARSKNPAYIALTIASGINPERAAKLYQSLGLKCAGEIYIGR